MKTEIERLVTNGKVDDLVFIMHNNSDWMKQLDAAEALAKLQDPRGQEFLNASLNSKNSDIREVTREILAGLNLGTIESINKQSYAGAGKYVAGRQRKGMILKREYRKGKAPVINKNRDFIIGFFGWFLVGNLVLFPLYAFLWDWWAGITSNFEFGVLTVIVVGILFFRNRNRIAYGILAAVITNTLLWIPILGVDLVFFSPILLLMGASVPLPLGIMLLGYP
jgi:hypothetical protein